jgi:hypothetical protein
VALFRATTVPGILPSELFPHRDRAPLSRPSFEVACSPAVVHQWSEVRCSSPFVPWFHRLPRFHAVAWIPRGLWTSFPWTEVLFPVVPGSVQRSSPPLRQLHLLRSLHPPVRPYQRLQVTSAAGRFSPGLFPFGAFPSTPRILDPPGQVLVWARSLVRRLGSATRRTIDPTSRVRPSSALVHKKISSTGSSLLKRMVRTASRRRLLLSWPWTWGEPAS